MKQKTEKIEKNAVDPRLASALKTLTPSEEYRYFTVHLAGASPLLMHRPTAEDMQRGIKKTIPSATEEAEAHTYRTANGGNHLMVPANCLHQALIWTSGSYRVPGAKKSIRPLIAGSFFLHPEELQLPSDDYALDVRGVMIQKARIARARAKVPLPWDLWLVAYYQRKYFELTGDPLPALRALFEEAGARAGLLDYNPRHSGPFGRFVVAEMGEIDAKELGGA